MKITDYTKIWPEEVHRLASVSRGLFFLRKIDLKFYVTLRSISCTRVRVNNDVMFYRESESSKKKKTSYDAKLGPTQRLSDHNS